MIAPGAMKRIGASLRWLRFQWEARAVAAGSVAVAEELIVLFQPKIGGLGV